MKKDDDFKIDDYRIPTFCPQCGQIMKGGPEVNGVYYKFKVCIHCFIEFIEDRVERWEGGWRPTKEQIKKMMDKLY